MGSVSHVLEQAFIGQRRGVPKGINGFKLSKLPKFDLTTDAEYVANYILRES